MTLDSNNPNDLQEGSLRQSNATPQAPAAIGGSLRDEVNVVVGQASIRDLAPPHIEVIPDIRSAA